VQVTAGYVFFEECCLLLGVIMQHCASMFGAEVTNIDIINRKTVWLLHTGLSDSDCCKVHELVCVTV